MAKTGDRLDKVVRDARRDAEKRATGSREQALKSYPPGGSMDALGRIVFDRLSQSLGQQFVLDYRPGASGNIGSEIAARAVPDGHTLLLNTLPFVVNPI